MEDIANLGKILDELRNISDQLSKIDKKDTPDLVNFYRDSLEFMTDENLKSYKLIEKLFIRQLKQARTFYNETEKVV
jgi:hypothetical protein